VNLYWLICASRNKTLLLVKLPKARIYYCPLNKFVKNKVKLTKPDALWIDTIGHACCRYFPMDLMPFQVIISGHELLNTIDLTWFKSQIPNTRTTWNNHLSHHPEQQQQQITRGLRSAPVCSYLQAPRTIIMQGSCVSNLAYGKNCSRRCIYLKVYQARFTSSLIFSSAAAASVSEEYLTNPYPLDFPVTGWHITFTVTKNPSVKRIASHQQKSQIDYQEYPEQVGCYLRQHRHAERTHPWELSHWCHRTDLQLKFP
jgi:hypothetical protein